MTVIRIYEFSKVAGYKIHKQNSITFLWTSRNWLEKSNF